MSTSSDMLPCPHSHPEKGTCQTEARGREGPAQGHRAGPCSAEAAAPISPSLALPDTAFPSYVFGGSTHRGAGHEIGSQAGLKAKLCLFYLYLLDFGFLTCAKTSPPSGNCWWMAHTNGTE